MRKRPQVQFHDFIVGETESPRPVPKSFHELVNNKVCEESSNRGVLGSTTGVKDIEKSGCFSILSKINKEDKVPFFPQLSRFRLSSETSLPPWLSHGPENIVKEARMGSPAFQSSVERSLIAQACSFKITGNEGPKGRYPRACLTLTPAYGGRLIKKSWSVSRNAKSMVFLWGILFAGNERE